MYRSLTRAVTLARMSNTKQTAYFSQTTKTPTGEKKLEEEKMVNTQPIATPTLKEEVRHVFTEAKETLKEWGEKAAEKVGDIKDATNQKFSQAGHSVMEGVHQVQHAGEKAKDTVVEKAKDIKDVTAEKLSHAGETVMEGVHKVQHAGEKAKETIVEKAKDIKDVTAEKLSHAGETIMEGVHKVQHAGEKAKDTIQEAAHKVMEGVHKAEHEGEKAKEAVAEKAKDVTEKTGEKLEKVGHSLREGARKGQ